MPYISPAADEWAAFPDINLSAWSDPFERQQMALIYEWGRRAMVAPDPADQQAEIDLNTTHRTSNGTDHGYIDQDVQTTASPTFVVVNFGSDGAISSSGSGVFQIAATGATYSAANIFSNTDHTFTGSTTSNDLVVGADNDSLQRITIHGSSGGATTKGAIFRLGNAGGERTNTDYWFFEANDGLDIGDDSDSQLFRMNSSGTITTKGGRIESTTRVTTTYQILVSDRNVFCDTDSAGFTATLPVGVDGQRIKVINCGTSGNTLTLAPNGTELLQGANSSVGLTDGQTLDLTYEATEGWY